MDKRSAKIFLAKFLGQKHTAREQQEFLAWLHTADEAETHDLAIEYEDMTLSLYADLVEDKRLNTLIGSALDESEKSNAVVPFYRKPAPGFSVGKIAAAASVLIILTSIAWFTMNTRQNTVSERTAVVNNNKEEILPGTGKATLTLSDGSIVVLDNTATNTPIAQAGAMIIKKSDGQVMYVPKESGASATAINVINVPRGGTYEIILPDQSRVWLNNSSSLKYPTRFTGNTRSVELDGEGYFEIAKDEAHPFIVSTDRVNVEVLGTHFNIMAYENEPSAQTTLLEGAVRLRKNNETRVMQPGDQGSVDQQGRVGIHQVDTENAIAWKNGLFQFNNAAIETVMHQVERWYNVEVKYSGKMPEGISGAMPRNVPLSTILQMLELTGKVHFSVDNRTVTVSA
jgi:transmembrane sensor